MGHGSADHSRDPWSVSYYYFGIPGKKKFYSNILCCRLQPLGHSERFRWCIRHGRRGWWYLALGEGCKELAEGNNILYDVCQLSPGPIY